VLIEHLVDALNTNTSFDNSAVTAFTNGLGSAGVAAFFVHTCLVLMYSLERLSQSGGQVGLRFYIRRFFRIYPLSVFCITMAVIFHIPNWPRPDAAVITPHVIFANLLLIQNLVTKISVIGPLWSLAYEVQMYLVLPALFYLTLRKRAAAYIGCLLALFYGLGLLLAFRTGHLNMAAYIPDFLCGVLCYTLRNRIRQFIPSALWPVFLLLLITGLRMVDLDTPPRYWTAWIFCLLLGFAINAFHDSGNKYINAIAGRVALYSYGMYLLHVPVLYLVFMVLGVKNIFAGSLLFAVLTVVASAITYHFLEAPLIEIGRKISSRPAPKPSLVLAK
jgi:peptidoglycan/LPS O-acetylase OafA/YrhL